MTHENVLIVLGALIALSPYLGLPRSILGFVLPVLGAVVLLIGVMLRRSKRLSLRRPASEHAAPVHEASPNV